MINILKQACTELQSDLTTVKIAGVLDRLHSWYKNLFDPEYKGLVNKLMEDSSTVKNNIKTLYRYIVKIDDAIKNGDVDNYHYYIENIKGISQELTDALSRLNVESSNVEKKKEPDLGNIQSVVVTDRNKQFHKDKIVQALKRGGIGDQTISEITDNPENYNALWGTITNAFLQGKILESRIAEPAQNRNGEMWVTIETNEFKVPNFPIIMQLKGIITDLFVRGLDPKNEARLKNIFWYRVKPMSGVQKLAKQVEKNITHVSGVDLAKILIKAYEDLGVSNPKPELVGSTWAQIVLEAGRDASGITLNNNNFGGVTAGNFDKKWNDSGWLESNKNWFETSHGLKFKSFSSPVEGAKEYIKTLAYLYPDSLKHKASGNQMEDAKYLRSKNYFGNVPYENYGSPMERMYGEFIKNIWPQIKTGESYEEPVKQQPDYHQEVSELSQYLGIAASSNLTQIVVNAISKEILPKSNILIKINSEDISAAITCASALSESLDKIVQADVLIHSNNKDVELNCSIPGENVFFATAAIADVVKNEFNNKYNTNIVISTKLNKTSELEKVGVARLELIKQSFIKKMPNGKYRVVSRKGKNLGEYNSKSKAKERLRQVEFFKHKNAEELRGLAKELRIQGKDELCEYILSKIAKETEAGDIMADLSYSFVMRNLRKSNKEKAKKFQEIFKKTFDEGYAEGIKDFEDVALFEAIKETGITTKELEKVD